MQDNIPENITIVEVGPRDGLQNEKAIVDTASKINFIEQLAEAGFKRIEITAFVSPRWIPPLADQMEVALGIKKKLGVSYAALVPNVKGYERAMATGAIDEVSIVIAASDQHNIKNLNADTAQVMQRYRELAERARQDKCPFRAYISCSFGCPYEGAVSEDRVLALAKDLLSLGAYEISISDTIGIANPRQCYELCSLLLKFIAPEKIALHMHDTRGMALANIYEALRLGIATFDSSAGGLGGCPYAPGAAGNVSSEDLVNMLNSLGLETGIDIKKVCESSLWIENLIRRNVPSKLVSMYRGMDLQR